VCKCEPEFPDASTAVSAALGGAGGLFGSFATKDDLGKGLAGGGPSGNRTSPFSRGLFKARRRGLIPNKVEKKARKFGRLAGRRLVPGAADLLKNEFTTKQSNISIDEKSHLENSNEDVKPLALTKSEMEKMSLRVRADLNLEYNEKLNALNLRLEGVKVCNLAQLDISNSNMLKRLTETHSHEWSAMSVPLDIVNDKWAILLNNSHSEERQKVTYLEECWHIMLGHKLTKIARIGSAYGRTYENTEEHDAYYLAAATLLPEKGVAEMVESQQSSIVIGEYFGTSPALVEYRIKRMGLWRLYKGIQIGFEATDS